MNILLSIKPKYAESIISGKKKYEFRKVIFKKNYIENVYIYCTSPVKRIIGVFRVGDIIEDRPERLWEQLNEFSGLEEKEFFDYFENIEKGFAIEIKSIEKFEDPVDPAKLIPGFVPPQSFYYVRFSLSPGDFQDNGKNRTIEDY
jgi:predicted transcriptional regulator